MSNTPDLSPLSSALLLMTRQELARGLDVRERTIRRWERGEVSMPRRWIPALHELLRSRVAMRPGGLGSFTFIDLFAGIGGIRKGFEDVGGHCIFSSEWDRFSLQTYRANFGNEDESIHTDIRSITQVSTDAQENAESIATRIPDHDVLLAGFPCQPFSLAGVSKKNSLGREHGFLCEAQGTLFFDVARIIEVKRPRAFLLENVKNLRSHDGGRTYRVIRKVLDGLGYQVFDRVIDAKGFVPQHRERIYLVGFRKPSPFKWTQMRFPQPDAITLASVLHPEDGTEPPLPHYTDEEGRVSAKYVLTDKLWTYLQAYRAKHEAKGNGFGFSKFGPHDIARTLSARYHKDGSEILIDRGPSLPPRRLTPRECARLMGFADDFIIPVSDTQAYRQFGNSVVVPVVREIARTMIPHVLATIEAERESAQMPLEFEVPQPA